MLSKNIFKVAQPLKLVFQIIELRPSIQRRLGQVRSQLQVASCRQHRQHGQVRVGAFHYPSPVGRVRTIRRTQRHGEVQLDWLNRSEALIYSSAASQRPVECLVVSGSLFILRERRPLTQNDWAPCTSTVGRGYHCLLPPPPRPPGCQWTCRVSRVIRCLDATQQMTRGDAVSKFDISARALQIVSLSWRKSSLFERKRRY